MMMCFYVFVILFFRHLYPTRFAIDYNFVDLYVIRRHAGDETDTTDREECDKLRQAFADVDPVLFDESFPQKRTWEDFMESDDPFSVWLRQSKSCEEDLTAWNWDNKTQNCLEV